MRILSMNEVLAKARKHEARLAKRVAPEEYGIVLDGHYVIDWERIDTPGKIVAWVHQLAGKGWVTAPMLARVIELAGLHDGIDVQALC